MTDQPFLLPLPRRMFLTGSLVLAGSLALAACGHLPPALTPAVTLSGHEVVLLGEVHDNAIGHQRRYVLLRQAIEAGWRPAIALEQFDRENQAALSQAQQTCGQDTQCLIRAGGGEGASWQWDFYRPVLALAQQYQLPLVAANLSRGDASRLVRQGVTVLPASDDLLRQALQAVPADLQQGQQDAVALGHCNQLPDNLLPAMATAQIARDVVMAAAIRPYRERGVVLLAGNGHVRNDLGVPRWLPGSRSIGFLEVPARVGKATGRYDRVIAIPAQDHEDACAKAGVGQPVLIPGLPRPASRHPMP